MNNFSERQNDPELLNLLKLQRYKYNKVPNISVLNFILSVIVPIILSIIGLFNIPNNYISYINYVGALCTIICLFLSSTLKTMKENAAKVQYIFDIQLFGFKRNNLICGTTITDLLIQSKKEKIQKQKGLENWYSIKNNINTVDAIFSCQQQNIRWDKKLRKLFLYFVLSISFISLFIIVSIAILNNLEFNILCSYIFLLLPIIAYCMSFIFSIMDNIKNQNELVEILKIYKSKKNISMKELTSLEEKIFHYRKDLVKIPNWFFNVFRKSMQKEADDYSKIESDKYTKF